MRGGFQGAGRAAWLSAVGLGAAGAGLWAEGLAADEVGRSAVPPPQPEKAQRCLEGGRGAWGGCCLVSQPGHCGFRERVRTDLLPAGRLPAWLWLSRWPPGADLCSGFLTQGPLLASSRLDRVVSRLQDRHAARRPGWTSVLPLVLPGAGEVAFHRSVAGAAETAALLLQASSLRVPMPA